MPGDGHLNPVLPLARALRTRHDVVFAGSPALGPAVEAAGFVLLPAGPAYELRDFNDLFPDLAGLAGEARTDAVYRKVFLGDLAHDFVRDLVAVLAAERPSLVIHDAANFAGALAARAAGLPYVGVAIAGLSGNRAYVRRYVELLDALRVAAGLAPDPELAEPWQHLLLSPVPRLFYGDAELPPTFRALQLDRYDAEAPPSWLQAPPARTTVYATLGTIHNRRPHILAAIAQAVEGEDVDLVLTTGTNQDPAELGPLPANVRAERYLPQLGIMPWCSAVICHGGSGTLRAAAWYGLPMVLVPIAADQPINARIFSDLGVAVTVPWTEATPATIRSALRMVLGDPAYRDRAAGVSREMRAMPGIERAVELVETIARGRSW